ncbi:MAG: hypothetical protein HYY13_01165 [Nitrospirae bacterium]|nr:hypothetical protein [Nitrospirota bacterium]
MGVIRAEDEAQVPVYSFFPPPALDTDREVLPARFPRIVLRPAHGPGEGNATDEAAPPPSPAEEAEHTAELILREAKKQADKILAQAWKEAESIQAMAREKGFELGRIDGVKKGEAAGFEKVKGESKPLFETLQAAIGRLAKVETEIRDTSEQQLYRLAVKIAQKIIKREIAAASPVVENLREAVRRAADVNRLVIRVNPQDLELVQRYRPALMAEVEGIKTINIQADAALKPGGCVVETNFGDIDARIESQLQELEKEIQQATRLGPS